jgi:hypothetical protein
MKAAAAGAGAPAPSASSVPLCAPPVACSPHWTAGRAAGLCESVPLQGAGRVGERLVAGVGGVELSATRLARLLEQLASKSEQGARRTHCRPTCDRPRCWCRWSSGAGGAGPPSLSHPGPGRCRIVRAFVAHLDQHLPGHMHRRRLDPLQRGSLQFWPPGAGASGQTGSSAAACSSSSGLWIELAACAAPHQRAAVKSQQLELS